MPPVPSAVPGDPNADASIANICDRACLQSTETDAENFSTDRCRTPRPVWPNKSEEIAPRVIGISVFRPLEIVDAAKLATAIEVTWAGFASTENPSVPSWLAV